MPLCICWYWFHRRQRLHSGPSGEGASSDGREVVGLQRGGPQSSDLEGNVYVYIKRNFWKWVKIDLEAKIWTCEYLISNFYFLGPLDVQK